MKKINVTEETLNNAIEACKPYINAYCDTMGFDAQEKFDFIYDIAFGDEDKTNQIIANTDVVKGVFPITSGGYEAKEDELFAYKHADYKYGYTKIDACTIVYGVISDASYAMI